MSLRAIQQLEKRALQLESRQKREKLKERLTMEKVVGFTTAVVASGVGGYLEGRFDLSDGVQGDGVRLFGVPAVPVGAAVLAGAGLAVGGQVGSAMGYAGLGIGCGWSYSIGAKKGLEGAIEKGSK